MRAPYQGSRATCGGAMSSRRTVLAGGAGGGGPSALHWQAAAGGQAAVEVKCSGVVSGLAGVETGLGMGLLPAAERAITGSFRRPFSSAPRRAQGFADLRLRYSSLPDLLLRAIGQRPRDEWRNAEGSRYGMLAKGRPATTGAMLSAAAAQPQRPLAARTLDWWAGEAGLTLGLVGENAM